MTLMIIHVTIYILKTRIFRNVKKKASISLRGIGSNFYSPGEMIIGNLEMLGRVIARGAIIDIHTIEKITDVSIYSCLVYCTWFYIKNQGSHCKIV